MKGVPQGRYTKEFREEAVKLVTEDNLWEDIELSYYKGINNFFKNALILTILILRG